MIKKIVLFFIGLFLFSCSNSKKDTFPDTIFTVQKMEKVMLDIHLLEASLNINVIKPGKASPLPQIFKKHHITPEQYQENFSYYTQHLDSLNKVYELMLIDLSEMQAEVKNKKEPAQDTIRQQPVK